MTSKYDDAWPDDDHEFFVYTRNGGAARVRKHSRVRAIKRRMAELEDELIEVSRWGDDDWPNGTVWMVEASYSGGETVYQFAAIKAADRWWITGPKQHRTSGRTWDDVVEWLNEFKAVTVWRVSALDEHKPEDAE